MNNKLLFELGQIVFLKSNPSIVGAVTSILPDNFENRYKIFVNGEVQTYFESQLQIENNKGDEVEYLKCEQFHSYLTSLQIRHPGLSTLYSLNAARVDFIPYQFRPVLRFIKSDRPRLLIADSVGVGKTIEAGLILRELQARRDIRSVLIICPRPLVTEEKWKREMKRFDESFDHLDGNTLSYCINEMDTDGVWPERYRKSIVPYSLFDENLLNGHIGDKKRRRIKGLLELNPPPRFDLVIVDEAHHIRNQKTFSHKAVRFFCDNAEAVVFLTATPIQLENDDLFVLLNILRPDLIIDKASFNHMAEPNVYINRAAFLSRAQGQDWTMKASEVLDQAAATSWGQAILKGSPDFIQIQTKLKEGNIEDKERVQVIKDIEAMHTFAGIINRTRRRDIGDFTIRKPETVNVEFTPEQKRFHDELIRIQTEILSRLYGDINVKFIMTTIRRQAASCIYGLIPLLNEILSRHLDELSWDEADNSEPVPQGDIVNSLQSQIQTILNNANSLNSNDPKLETLFNFIYDKLSLLNNRIMLFSSFRHTLNYLYEHLSAKGFRVGMAHGGTPDEERVEIRNRFEKSKEETDSIDILLLSEIGSEGLDYQFCDCIVNYDLPWNPMRIEQRIGRIDRKGQKSEIVKIVNFITPGTVDADIYERCLKRIGVFNNALGFSEEILGEITKEIRSIAENYSLNEEDRKTKFQQLSDNKIRLLQEQEELEQRQMELFGVNLPEDQMKKEIENASSFWLSPDSIKRIVTMYLNNTFDKDHDFILGEKPLKTLRLSQDMRNRLLYDFQEYKQINKQNNSSYKKWEDWLKNSEPNLSVTFESECAAEHPEAAFIMPLHPLVRQASMSFIKKRKKAIIKLKVRTDEVSEGIYKFVIYQWSFSGIREDQVLKPIASSDDVTIRLEKLLERAADENTDDIENNNSLAWDELNVQHYKLWSETLTKHQQHTQELAKYRRESLLKSHAARIALLEEQLKQSNDEKIQKMRKSQMAAAEADYSRHINDLDIAIKNADIKAEPVAYGILKIYRGNKSNAE